MTDPVAARFAAVIEQMLVQDYVAAIAHLRHLDAREGKWRYRHQYLNAIARIEARFQEIFGDAPWPEDIHHSYLFQCQNEIGYYCSRLGVATLIDDLREAAFRYKPQSLLYFIRSHDEHRREQSSRWEMLLYARMEEEWQETKRQEAEEANKATQNLGMKMKKPVPAWVIEARETLQGIKTKASPTPEERQEAAKIEAIMSRMGISPA